MRIYLDLRSLQDPAYSMRGVGLHGSTLLSEVKAHALVPVEMIGMIDEELPALPEVYHALVDKVQHSRTPRPSSEPSVFVQLSPMTHDQSSCAPFLGRQEVLAVTLIYDFIPLSEKRYLPTAASSRSYLSNLAWLRHYQLYFPISKWTAHCLNNVLGPSADKVEVTGVSLRREFTACSQGEPVARPGHPFAAEPYFVLVGGQDQRKNLDTALRAHASLGKRLATVSHFVVVGGYTDAYIGESARFYQSLGGKTNQLHFLRGISDGDLASLYRYSIGSVCASLNEGFSVPVVEGIACRTPVLASDIEAHRELVEQPEARFSPLDSEALAGLMERIITDATFGRRLVADQGPMASRYTQKEVGGKFWSRVFQEYRCRYAKEHLRRAIRKPRIAILSPYPPDQSGVADYTAHSLKYLADHAEIDLYTDARPVGAHPYVRRFEPITEKPYVNGEYDRVLSVIGNSHFHMRMIDFHNRYGGACLVHDNRLAELYNWWRGPEQFARMASKSLGRHVDVAETSQWMRNPGTLPSIFFDEVLVQADPLIVHSRGIQAHVEKQYGKSSKYLPFCPYRLFPAAQLEESERNAARARLNVPRNQIAIISLGMLGNTKAPFDCLHALEFLRGWNVCAHFYFVGSPADMKNRLLEQARELSIEPQLHFMAGDWTSEQQYRDYLLAADFGIQLRTHGFGGLSGALLDCISAGLPTVANQDLADAMDSPHYVYRVPDHLSPVLIAERIADGLAAGAHLNRLSKERDAYVRDHSFETYAVQMMQVLGLA